jgi:hypothetical protein
MLPCRNPDGQRFRFFNKSMQNSAVFIKAALMKELPAVCEFLLPGGHPDGTNWRVGSLKGEDGSSLSVCLQGHRKGYWKDFAETDSGGDILNLWMQVQKVSFRDALQRAQAWLIHGCPRQSHTPADEAPLPKPNAQEPVAMPCEVASLWAAGIEDLRKDPNLQAHLDKSRGWPAGTTETLSSIKLLGCPRIQGEPHWAFPVQHPVSDATVQIGFHALATREGSRKWTYRPNIPQDSVSITGLPFVIGAQEFRHARLLVILEGQWDAIAGSAAAGWLNLSHKWPHGVAVFGIRGATNWRSFLEFWGTFWPKSAEVLVIPDADDAGDTWHRKFAPELQRRAQQFASFALPRGMDFSDLNRIERFSSTDIADRIECLGLTPI